MEWSRYRKASELAGEVFPVSEAVILDACFDSISAVASDADCIAAFTELAWL